MKKILLLIMLMSLTFLIVGCECNHKEEVWEGKAATCTETGLTDGAKCKKCGLVLKDREEIPATGHDFEEYVSISITKHSRTCKSCGKVETYTHEWDDGEIIETNEETGRAKTKFTCKYCGHEEIVEHEIGAIVFPPVPLN